MNTTRFVGVMLTASVGLLLTASTLADTIRNPIGQFNVHTKAGTCPAGVRGKDRCLFVTGDAVMMGGMWTTLDHVDVPGNGPKDVPSDCIPQTTTGTLKSKEGLLHFRGAGYYCLKSDTGTYQIEFNDKDAERFGLPKIGEFMFHGTTAKKPATEVYIALVEEYEPHIVPGT